MYEMTQLRREALAKMKNYHAWRYSYTDNPILSGNGHERYARYVEWCRSRNLPAAPIGTWAAINATIQG